MSRAKNPIGVLPYLDVVEEALCFGWIDSTLKTPRWPRMFFDFPLSQITFYGSRDNFPGAFKQISEQTALKITF